MIASLAAGPPSFRYFSTFPALARVISGRPYSSISGESVQNDPDVQAAREWMKSASVDTLPKGIITMSRSSGPGGQHVNKTETKATTAWPLASLLPIMPKILHDGIRKSRYYTKGNDSLSLQSQTHRSKPRNIEENRQKLFDEIQRIYKTTVPGEVSAQTKEKYKALKRSANESRIREKKHHSAKKSSRRGPSDWAVAE